MLSKVSIWPSASLWWNLEISLPFPLEKFTHNLCCLITELLSSFGIGTELQRDELIVFKHGSAEQIRALREYLFEDAL